MITSIVKAKSDTFRAAGWRWLGEGSRAIALAHPGDPSTIMRIAHYDHDKATQEDAWLHYYEAFKDHGSLHFPEIRSVVRNTDHYIVMMERLFPLRTSQGVCDKWPGFDLFHSCVAAHCEKKEPDWIKMDWCDLHTTNCLIRANGCPVITDPYYTPWSFEEKLQRKRVQQLAFRTFR